MIRKILLLLILFNFFIVNNLFAYDLQNGFADLTEKLIPSVVNISAKQKQKLKDDSPIRYKQNSLLEKKNNKIDASVSLGSGFVIGKDGYILTNNHVVENSDDIIVTVENDKKYNAKIIGFDKVFDLAVLKIEVEDELLPVIFANSNKIRVGDWVLAFGNPFGLGTTLTTGVVSAKSRDINSGPYDNYIQTDASINQGNSGGPMYNLDGELIGINSFIFSSNGMNQGIGFAVPSNIAKWVSMQLVENGKINHGYIGFKIDRLVEVKGEDFSKAVMISSIDENSPAIKAGLEVGDLVLSFNNKKIENLRNLAIYVAEAKINEKSKIKILRNSEIFEKDIIVVKERKPRIKEVNIKNNFANMGIAVFDFGLKLTDKITDEMKSYYKIDNQIGGLLILDVESNSDAFVSGLQKGEIILKVEGQSVASIDELIDLVKIYKDKNVDKIKLLVQGKSGFNFVLLKI
jgi:serine protease Do